MIKIIKKGTRKQATCDSCGCVFSYEAEDVHHFEYQNGNYGYDVTCPQCKDKIVVSQTR